MKKNGKKTEKCVGKAITHKRSSRETGGAVRWEENIDGDSTKEEVKKGDRGSYSGGEKEGKGEV